ncbi:MAG: ABC transporter [Sphingobacteriales bacterium 17-39-43]|uniref:ABC-F family ATP-binding cassette domain-containing protein n=1 Tax=Daejeonella sp. TaxID=2805397 RepID=UPI000BCD26A7|nr:ABC-F family ATP-binding cassette domain-containing protein [Daejeonella sp.]OYZ32257.1 MAG: ABC transporter [Sphingobacteriales bacterium 16-39-50]OZA25602.1 MAG: ABC transporter [Sphingobacteriales bacterium 17-39-43]OZA61394.1 MAG: ABC transporter [Sphingobacteriales bacterium 39-40-5]HQS50879.1 ABC-F family ATP-binding cassette domain-containing protein [Daejeonella sp.]HQT22117.1 ABC-F family ATP-binding cassette domain-containing protein [Daejeonella sp.]
MSILSTEQLGHSFNDNWLFKDLYFGLNKGDRVALVGINGTGKSTLLRILSGILQASLGKVVTERDLRIGYLEQDPQFSNQETISDFIYSIGNERQQLIRQYEEAVNQEVHDEKVLNRLMDELSNANAWEYEYEIKTILGRMGIQHLEQKIATLSGGQRKRLALAKLLIDDPDVYILDEPTNHLDIETIEWLESYMTSGQKTILLVTHDRYFLDNVSTRIIELDRGKIQNFNGNYSYYLEKKAEQNAAEDATFSKNTNLLKKELEWMRRQPKARTTKSKSRIDSFYDLEEKTKGRNVKSSLELSVNVSRQGNKILELEHVGKSFNGKPVINDFSYTFKKGDRIGVAGKNGTGKSTLLNIITGVLKPDSGKVNVGETTVFGYYRQGGLEFKDDERVIDVVKNIAEYITMADGKNLTASQVLTHFLFPPAKQYGMVNKLSGGEKKRLQLMRVLMKNPNYLILDEPTNDLDIDTLNVLEDFLLNFPGILMLVSHDRYLIDRLTDQLFIFEGDGNVQIYTGNYTDYRLEQEEPKKPAKPENKATAIAPKSETTKRKLSFKEEKERSELEISIKELEEQVEVLTLELNSGITDHNKLTDIATKIKDIKDKIDEQTFRWLELSE